MLVPLTSTWYLEDEPYVALKTKCVPSPSSTTSAPSTLCTHNSDLFVLMVTSTTSPFSYPHIPNIITPVSVEVAHPLLQAPLLFLSANALLENKITVHKTTARTLRIPTLTFLLSVIETPLLESTKTSSC